MTPWPITLPAQQARDPVFTASEGKVFRRGVYLAEPSKLLVVFLACAEGDDWGAKLNADLATELQDAISVAEAYHNPVEQRSAA